MKGNIEERLRNQFIWLSRGLCSGVIVGIVLGVLMNNITNLFLLMTSLGGIIGYFINELSEINGRTRMLELNNIIEINILDKNKKE